MDIDDLFRERFDDFSVEPGSGVSTALMRKVGRREFLRFNPGRFNVYYLTAAVVSAGLALIITLSDISTRGKNDAEPEEPDYAIIENPTGKEGVSGQGDQEMISDVPVISGKASVDTKPLLPVERSGEKPDTRVRQSYTVSIDPPAGSGITRIITVTETTDLKSINEGPVSSIKASAVEGCAPLSIRFQSTSEKYERLIWTSSDGRRSEEKDIEWLFTEPGDHRIILHVTGKDGKEDYSSIGVTVYPSPSARFEVATVNNNLNDREIVFYNSSDGALTTKWSFGDGETSLLREPVHIYGSSGSYTVKLTVTNEYGCSDTASLVYNVADGNYHIAFPNAFIPNKNGPTGGFYSPRSDEAAYVFHPEYEGVADYHLIVYSRTGAVLFESRNLNIGWDGYYKGQLCEPGVYVWRARGRYDNGEAFSESGDITLLRF
jgi:PKD repeat protein